MSLRPSTFPIPGPLTLLESFKMLISKNNPSSEARPQVNLYYADYGTPEMPPSTSSINPPFLTADGSVRQDMIQRCLPSVVYYIIRSKIAAHLFPASAWEKKHAGMETEPGVPANGAQRCNIN